MQTSLGNVVVESCTRCPHYRPFRPITIEFPGRDCDLGAAWGTGTISIVQEHRRRRCLITNTNTPLSLPFSLLPSPCPFPAEDIYLSSPAVLSHRLTSTTSPLPSWRPTPPTRPRRMLARTTPKSLACNTGPSAKEVLLTMTPMSVWPTWATRTSSSENLQV